MRLDYHEGMTVVDAGANIGMFSLFAWRKCHGNLTLHAFEPMPAIFSVLQENILALAREFKERAAAASGAAPRLRAHNVGLSECEARVEFEFHPYMSLWSTGDREFDMRRAVDVKAYARLRASKLADQVWVIGPVLRPALMWLSGLLADVMNRSRNVPCHLRPLGEVLQEEGVEGVDLLKVDVEGAELSVLRGIEDAQWAGVRQVVMEVENAALRDEIVELLEGKGFAVYWMLVMQRESPESDSQLTQLIAVRPE